MLSSDEDKIKATLLYHLRRKEKLGGAHAPFDTLQRGFPSHLGKDIKKQAEKLIRKGWLLTKPAAYGLQVMLNKDKINEIEAFIQKILGLKF